VGNRGTRFACVRYGNVVGSRGSVIPHWLSLAARGAPLPLTDERMTRFWITLQQACGLVAWAGEHAGPGDVVVPSLPRSRMADMAHACWAAAAPAGAQNAKSPPAVSLVGERPGGEKLHECLLTEHEGRIARSTLLPGGGAGWLVRHGSAPVAGHDPVAPLMSDQAPLLTAGGCIALLEGAGLVGAGALPEEAAA
jgi:hypothetical protein